MNKKDRTEAQKTAEMCALLSCPSRVLILKVIIQAKEIAVQDIAESLSMTHSAVSHQLGILVAGDVVTYVKEGRIARYRISTSPAARIARRVLALS
jgi:DNA-binding transcriptional ArsR family regulator